MFMFTRKWIGLQTSKVEEAVVLVSINPVQIRETLLCSFWKNINRCLAYMINNHL